jgi:hypothetical protein
MHQGVDVMIFLIYNQNGIFMIFCVNYFLPFFFDSFLLTIVMFGKGRKKKENDQEIYIITAFLYHDPSIFAVREPLLPLSPQNPLDRDFWIT